MQPRKRSAPLSGLVWILRFLKQKSKRSHLLQLQLKAQLSWETAASANESGRRVEPMVHPNTAHEPYKEQLATVADAVIISVLWVVFPHKRWLTAGPAPRGTVADRCVRPFTSVKRRLLIELTSGQADSNINIASPVELRVTSADGTLSGRRAFYLGDICYDGVLGLPWKSPLCCSGRGAFRRQTVELFACRGRAEEQVRGPVKERQSAVECRSEKELGEATGASGGGGETIPVQYRARWSASAT